MFEFWIDGIKYKNPLNWKDFTETIEYDGDLKVFLFKYENKLNFSGDAFQYLYNKRNTGGICYIATLLVKKQCAQGSEMKPFFTGNIFVSDCNFFINDCQVECSVQDNNYAASIFNNKDLRVQLELFKSKNGTTMPLMGGGPFSGQYYLNQDNFLRNAINMFDPSDGSVIGGQDLRIYFLHDVFTYLVYFLSDGNVGFISDYFNYLTPIATDAEKVRQLVLTKGKDIRLYGQNKQEDPVVSFQQLFDEVNKRFPIVLSVESDVTGKPIIRIEDEGYYRTAGSSITLNKLLGVKEKADNSLLYGVVRIGGPVVEYNSSLHSYPPTEQITFKEESYYLTGGCNTSTEKNLLAEYIQDTNIIQEIFITDPSNTDWDEELFFIEVDPTTGTITSIYDAISTLNYSTPIIPYSYHYNDSLLNKYTIARETFHSDVYQALSVFPGTDPVIVDSFDGSNYFANVVSFDYALSETNYDIVRFNPQKSITWNIGGPDREAWIKRTVRTLETSQMSWELITNLANSK